MGQADDTSDYGKALMVLFHAVHKRSVNLKNMKGETAQIAEGREACTKVIDAKLNAEPSEF